MSDSQEHFKRFAQDLKYQLGSHRAFHNTGKNVFLETYKECHDNLEPFNLLPKRSPSVEELEKALNALEKEVERVTNANSSRDVVTAAKIAIARIGTSESGIVSLHPLGSKTPDRFDYYRNEQPRSALGILTAADSLIGDNKYYNRLSPITSPSWQEDTEKLRSEQIAEDIADQLNNDPLLAQRAMGFGISVTATNMILNAEKVIKEEKRRPRGIR